MKAERVGVGAAAPGALALPDIITRKGKKASRHSATKTVILFFALVFAGLSNVAAQAAKASPPLIDFKGEVTDIEDKGLGDVDILIEGVSPGTLRRKTLVTDKAGKFRGELAAGIYQFVLSKEGHKTWMAPHYEVSAGERAQGKFVMPYGQCSDCEGLVQIPEPEPIARCRAVLKDIDRSIEVEPLFVRSVRGQLPPNVPDHIAASGGICAGLISTKDQRLVALTVAKKDRTFDFGYVPRGPYQLVLHFEGIRSTGYPIKVVGWPDTTTFKDQPIKVRYFKFVQSTHGFLIFLVSNEHATSSQQK